MKVAISIPDPIFERAEQLATELGMSRSRLYTRAVEEFVKEHPEHDVRRRLEEVYGDQAPALDPILDELQTEALREEW